METSTVRALLEALPEAILCVNASGCVAVVSARMEALCGWPRAELLERPVQVLFPRAGGEGLGFLLESVHPDEGGAGAEFELHLLHQDGRELPVCVRRSSLETGEGRFLCLTLREGGEPPAAAEQRIIQALRESHRRVTAMLESITDGMISLDREWRVLYVSPRSEWLLGPWRGSMLGRCLWDVFPSAVDSYFYQQYHRAVAEQTSIRFEEYSATVDRWFEVHAFPSAEGLSVYFRDIHARKEAEAALRRDREWLELAHSAGGMGAWEWDLRTDRAIWSESYYELLGLEPRLVATYSLWLERVHPDDLGLVEANFASVVTGGRFVCEYRIVRRDGQLRWHYSVGTSYLDAEGRPHQVVGISVDVTERKLAESALRESEERYRSLVDNATDLIYSHGMDGRFLSINQAGEKITGYTRDELLQMTLLDLVAPEYWDLLRQRAAERTVHGNLGRTTCELELVARDGRRVPVEVSSVPLIRDGRTIAIQGIARDITERRAAEEALHASEARFRVICEASPIGVFLCDAEGSGVYSNPTMLRYLGLDEQSARNAGWRSALHPDDAPQIVAAWEHAVANHADFELTHRLVRSDGTEIHVVVRAAPIRQKNVVIGFVGSAVDITERVTLEEQLRQSQKMDAVGRLAGGVAHDFNNMLAVINGYSELCLGEVGPESPWREPLQEIHRAGERAAALTRQLLAFSRKQMLRPVRLDLNRVVSDTHTMLSRLIGEDILLGTRLDPDLGRIHADPGQIEQVLLNLAVNARDAMPRGGRLVLATRNVTLDAAALRAHAGQAPGLYVLLEVSDTGCGMTPEVQARIFEPFFTTKSLGEGTGLGLATVYGIVSQSGGHLEVESAPGAGSTFRIYLPAVAETPEPAPAPASEAPPGSETLLLVEDEPMVRTLIRTVLESYGYHVLEAGTPEELDRVLAQYRGPLDLLITDVVMPTRSGPEVSTLLRLRYPELKVLYISGYTDDAVLQHGVSTAETAFLQKPFSPVALAQKVRELLN